MTWLARAKGTDWTGAPILPIHTGIYTTPDTAAVPIALVHTETPEGKKNAALIAAAPTILAALKRYEELFEEVGAEATWNRKKNRGATNWGIVNDILCQMRDAIHEAEKI